MNCITNLTTLTKISHCTADVRYYVHCLDYKKTYTAFFSVTFYKYLIKGKGKVHSCTGTEAVYRPYDP